MKKYLVPFLFICSLSLSFNICNAQWVQQYKIGNLDIQLDAIQFVNANTGFVVGEEASFNVIRAVFLKTTNGGVNWVRINMNLTNEHWLYALSFIDENTGFVCGKTPYVRKTTDGGQTWSSYMVTTNTPNFNAIQFLNGQTGYIGGRYGMLAKSTNGGVNWFSLDSAYNHINALHFFDVNTGILADSYSGIYKTTNAGINWNYQFMTDSSSGFAFLNMSFASTNTGYIVGATPYNGTIVKTTNSGSSWNTMKIFPNKLYSVCGLTNANVYVGGAMTYILNSSDAGLSWRNQQLSTTWLGLFSIYFVNLNTGYACVRDEIFKTENGGVGVESTSTEIPNNYILYQNYPNPFNSSTIIKFSLKKPGNVSLIIYGLNGKEITSIIEKHFAAGEYQINYESKELSSGVYICRMNINNTFKNIKLIVLK